MPMPVSPRQRPALAPGSFYNEGRHPAAHAIVHTELSRAFHRDIKGFTAEAEQVLLQHSWPGNVRELRNRVERAVAMLQAQ